MTKKDIRQPTLAYLKEAASSVGYVDVDGRSLTVLCVHSDVPFDVLVKEVTQDDGKSLLKLLEGRCELIDARVFRALKDT